MKLPRTTARSNIGSLLPDPAFLPDCRPLLGTRPHASFHLRHALPPQTR